MFSEPLLHEVHVLLASLINRTFAIESDYIHDAGAHQNLRTSDACSTNAANDHFEILHLFLDDLQSIDQSR